LGNTNTNNFLHSAKENNKKINKSSSLDKRFTDTRGIPDYQRKLYNPYNFWKKFLLFKGKRIWF